MGDHGSIPALIGSRMAESAGLQKGDELTVQWRDLHGTFDARDVKIVEVMKTSVQEIDNEQIWIPLDRLQTLMAMPGQATIIVMKKNLQPMGEVAGWKFKSLDYLLQEIHSFIKSKSIGASVLYVLLLLLALLAIFDTQVLSIFRRKKEMGTLMALGMTRIKIIELFTLEGALQGVLAAIVAAAYGIPLLTYIARTGWALPEVAGTYRFCIRRKTLSNLFRRIGYWDHTSCVVGHNNCQLFTNKKNLKLETNRCTQRKNDMIRFLLKGLLRDRSRSLFPVLVVATGVMLTVFLHAWINGAISSLVQLTAHYRTGHVCVMTKAYAEKVDQIPNDLALLGIDTLLETLNQNYPALHWTPRITFGGLLDIPDDKGETKEQAPVSGLGVDLFTQNSSEWKVMNIQPSLVQGELPKKCGDLLISEKLANKLHVQPGQKATLISSTTYGSMTFANFTIVGTIRFGVAPIDRSTIIADLSDIQQALDMQGGAGEILGFFQDDLYHEDKADTMAAEFNAHEWNSTDKFSPFMQTLRKQSGLSDYLDFVGMFMQTILAFFVFVMSIVLWNAGLTGSLRRYGEYGLRLAVGENKGHIYRLIIIESLAVGIIGSLIGTAIGLAISYYLQLYGINIESMMKDRTMMLSDVVRAQVTPMSFLIGFLPGVLATFLGSAISGIGIYKRQTAQLFKELET